MRTVVFELTMPHCGSWNGRWSGEGKKHLLFQRMLGTRIAINMETHTLTVPTPYGYVGAYKGDMIVLYDDGTLEVLKGGE